MAPNCVCNQRNSVIHAKNCHHGGYISLHHDSVKDYFHKKTSIVFNETEPKLKPVDGQTLNAGANIAEGARPDIRIMSFERNFQNTHLDVKVLNIKVIKIQAETHTSHFPKDAIPKAEDSKTGCKKTC